MIQGRLREDIQAVVELEVVGLDRSSRTVPAIIDTGFNEQVSLARRVVDELNLPLTYEGTVEVELASGTGLLTGKLLLMNFVTREVIIKDHVT